VDSVEGGACSLGCGADVAGTVVSCPGCTRLAVGDEVWALGSHAYAEYASMAETKAGVKPKSLTFTEAGSLPQAIVTSYLSLKRTDPVSPPGTPMPMGAPWQGKSNITVVVTAGSGGTGFTGIELAMAWGATNVITASTGEGIEFCYGLGATLVGGAPTLAPAFRRARCLPQGLGDACAPSVWMLTWQCRESTSGG